MHLRGYPPKAASPPPPIRIHSLYLLYNIILIFNLYDVHGTQNSKRNPHNLYDNEMEIRRFTRNIRHATLFYTSNLQKIF